MNNYKLICVNRILLQEETLKHLNLSEIGCFYKKLERLFGEIDYIKILTSHSLRDLEKIIKVKKILYQIGLLA